MKKVFFIIILVLMSVAVFSEGEIIKKEFIGLVEITEENEVLNSNDILKIKEKAKKDVLSQISVSSKNKAVINNNNVEKITSELILKDINYGELKKSEDGNFYELSATAFFYTGLTVDKQEFIKDNGVLISYKGSSEIVEIEDDVFEISSYAFLKNDKIKTIKLNNNLKSIGDYAFCGCKNLENINIPDSVENIGVSAFQDCSSLSAIHISAKMTEIRNCTFAQTGLREIEIPSNIKFIGFGAFVNNKLRKINLNNGIEYIGSFAFSYDPLLGVNDELTELVIPDSVNEIDYFAFTNFKNLQTLKLGKGLKKIAKCAFACDSENFELESIDIPDSVNVLGDGAFSGFSNVSKINFGKNLEIIGEYAFNGNPNFVNSKLQYLEIPDSVTEIKESAFRNFKNLQILKLGNGLKVIGKDAFKCVDSQENTVMEEIIIPDSVVSIGYAAFSGHTGLKNIHIGKNVEIIDEFAFDNDSKIVNTFIEKLEIPDSVKEIRTCAFRNFKNLQTLKLGKGLKVIGDGAFKCNNEQENTVMEEIVIPDSVVSIGYAAFSGHTGFKNIHIGKNVEIIDEFAFSPGIGEPIELFHPGTKKSNDKLKEIIIPDSVTSLGSFAFAGYTRIEKILLGKNLKKIDFGTFSCIDSKENNVMSEIIIPNSIQELEPYAFANFTNLKYIKFGKGLNIIGKAAFASVSKNNTIMEDIVIPDNVICIGESAFSGYINLKKLHIGNKVETIGEFAFTGDPNFVNSKLQYLEIPDSVIEIKKSAFRNFKNLQTLKLGKRIKVIGEAAFKCSENQINSIMTEISMPDSVETIGYAAFSGYSNIHTIYLGKNLKTIEDYAFYCYKEHPNMVLKKLIIPDSVETIGYAAFSGYSNIHTIYLGKNLKTIEDYAFYCYKEHPNMVLKKLIIPETVEKIGDNAFLNYNNIKR